MSWDGENRLTAAQPTAAAVAAGAPNELLTFTYDARGRRISKKVRQWENGAWVFAREQRPLLELRNPLIRKYNYVQFPCKMATRNSTKSKGALPCCLPAV